MLRTYSPGFRPGRSSLSDGWNVLSQAEVEEWSNRRQTMSGNLKACFIEERRGRDTNAATLFECTRVIFCQVCAILDESQLLAIR